MYDNIVMRAKYFNEIYFRGTSRHLCTIYPKLARFTLEREGANLFALDAESMPDSMIKPTSPPSALSIL